MEIIVVAYDGRVMEELDLKLLRVFDEIYRTRSVSRAAESIGVTQPSLSIALAKLRKHFQDPLFVRTSAGMQPTPCAAELIGPVRDGLDLLDRALRHRATFDPASAERAFRLCLTDISQAVLLPSLLNRLTQVAPAIRLEVVPISSGTARMLESGDADLAIGFMPQLEAGFYQQKLFRQRFVCAVRQDHPRIGDRLTLKRFAAEDHVVVTADATGHSIVDEALEAKGVVRRVALRLPEFLGLAPVVAGTDLVATIPDRLGEVLRHAARVKLLPVPIALPTYLVKQHWHERYHHDAANRWLRGLVAGLFLE
jgi:DNA-binding transcriptional LysR family regulator